MYVRSRKKPLETGIRTGQIRQVIKYFRYSDSEFQPGEKLLIGYPADANERSWTVMWGGGESKVLRWFMLDQWTTKINE